MNEDIELIIEETRDRMEKALEHLEHELARLRAGRSNPALLDGITVDYYGVISPLDPGIKYQYSRCENNSDTAMGKEYARDN